MNERIKEIRKSKGLTQSEFGAKIGVKGNTITNYESGGRTPSDAIIVSICREFDVNEHWLRTGEGDMFVHTVPNTIDQLARKFSLDDLIKKYWACTPSFLRSTVLRLKNTSFFLPVNSYRPCLIASSFLWICLLHLSRRLKSSMPPRK